MCISSGNKLLLSGANERKKEARKIADKLRKWRGCVKKEPLSNERIKKFVVYLKLRVLSLVLFLFLLLCISNER